MGDNVEVKLGAQTDDLKSAFTSAATNLRESTQQMVTALKALEGQSVTTGAVAKQSAQGMGAAFGQMKDQIGTHINGVTSALTSFKTFAIGLGAIFAGGFLWKEAIDGMLKMESEVLHLQNVMGMMSDKATTTAIALNILGKSADDYTAMSLKLERQVKSNEKGLNELGIVTRDASGHLLDSETQMQNAFKTLQDYKAGADQAQVALTAFGRGANEVYDIMVRLPAAQARAVELQKQLGIEYGPERVAAIESYRIELGATKVVFETIGEKIGEAVMPQLAGLASWFNDVGPAAAKAIVNAIKGIIIVFDALITAVRIVSIAVGSFIKALAVNVDTMVALLKAAANPSLWGTIPDIIKHNTDRVVEITKQGAAAVVAEWDGAAKRIGALLTENGPGAAGPGTLKSGKKTVPEKAGPAESRMAGWQAELAAQRDAFEQMKLNQGSFEQWSIEQTVQYWAAIRARSDLSVKERAEVDRNYYSALRTQREEAFAADIASLEQQKEQYRYASQERINIATAEYNLAVQRYGAESAKATAAYKQIVDERRKLADQTKAIDDEREKQTTLMLEHETKMEEITGTQDVALRRISTEQKLALDAKLENDRYQIAYAGMKARQALETDPAKIEAYNTQLEQLELTHQEKLTQIDNAAVLERNQFVLGAQAAVQSSFATLFDDLISHTKTLKQTLLDFVKSLTDSLNKLASEQIAKQLFGAGSQGNSIIGSLFGGEGGGGGGAGLFSFLQGLLPGFADGTSFVPRDMPVFVHAGEAIVPARYNTGIGGGVAGAVHNTVNVQFSLSGAVDGRTQDQIAARTARAVQRATNRNV